MPDHIHAVVFLHEKAGGASPSPTLNDVICAFKALTSRSCKQKFGNGRIGVWALPYAFCNTKAHQAKPMPLILLRIIHRSTSGQGFRKYISRSPRNPFVL